MSYYDDEYFRPQEHTSTYDLVSYQDSVSFSGYGSYDLHNCNIYTVSELDDPKFVDHYHHLDNYDYDYDYGHNSYMSTNHEINYFAYNYVEPKLIAYEPVACDTGYVSYHTQYSIAYPETDLGFNEPAFEEYDPTPYGGGYDIVSVYGMPLPPSDKTCYPRSKPKPKPESKPEPTSSPKPKPKHESKPGPTSSLEPKPISKPTPIPRVEPKAEPEHDSRSKPEPESMHVPVLVPPTTKIPSIEPELKPGPDLEPVHVPVPIGERDEEEYSFPNYGFDYPWPEYDHGYGIGARYDYGLGNQVVQVPPIEYDPEVVDLCENIFGNWPCLARIREQQMRINNNNPGITCPQNGHKDPWEECANYIFGCPSCNK